MANLLNVSVFLIDKKSDFNAMFCDGVSYEEGGPTHVEQNKQNMKIGIFHPHDVCLEHD